MALSVTWCDISWMVSCFEFRKIENFSKPCFPNADEYRFIEVQRDDLDASVGATLTNVSKLYGEQVAVSDVNLSLSRDKITCLLGRNGAGKSTIM